MTLKKHQDELLTKAIQGNSVSIRHLIDELTPVVQTRIARTLLRWHHKKAISELRQEMEDLVQDVFVALFADDSAILRSWDKDRGLSLANFVGLVAERQTGATLRTGKRNPWRESPAEMNDLEINSIRHGQSGSPAEGLSPDGDGTEEARLLSRQALQYLWQRLKEDLSPVGRRLFELLYVHGWSAQEVCAEMKMTPEAVWAWRSRLGKRARQILSEPKSGFGMTNPIPKGVGTK